MIRGHPEAPRTSDLLNNEPIDQYGIPLSIKHSAQTDLPVWQFIHKLAIPIANPKSADRLFTHICVLCSASPPMRPTSKRVTTWRNALMRQRMSTNAVAHMQRVHPEEFGSIADFKQRKRQALADKAPTQESPLYPKKAKLTSSSKATSAIKCHVDATKPLDTIPEGTGAKTQRSGALARTRKTTTDLIQTWLLSSGLPVSVLANDALQHLLQLATPTTPSVVPLQLHFDAHVHEAFTKFQTVVASYLASEFQAAMKLPFLSLRHDYCRPTQQSAVEQHKGNAFLSLALGLIDSTWHKVDLVLAATHVPTTWHEQLPMDTVSQTYHIPGLSHYVRFQVGAVTKSPATAASDKDATRLTHDEDVLTHTLRTCVMDALDVGPTSDAGAPTGPVCRILQVLQELRTFFDAPERATAIAKSGTTPRFLASASSVATLARASLTPLGAIAELLRVSCSRYRAYGHYFHAPDAPDHSTNKTWSQLSLDDWQTVTEVEALLNHLVQFRLEERTALRPGAIASSYVLLFRRLLSLTVTASSFKCFSLEDEAAAKVASPKSCVPRRKAKRVDTFTPAGRHCIERLAQLITQRFTTADAAAVDDEIKAMVLDPRISAKAITLVKDPQVFHRAHEALRQEHRTVFHLLAAPHSGATDWVEDGDEDDDEDEDEDDEIRSLLMVEGPTHQPPPLSTMTSGRRSSDSVLADEARAWQEWQQVHVAWDAIADKGADLLGKGQYNLLKLYHHVNILQWFRDVGQQAHPAAALLARIYLGKQVLPSRSLEPSMMRFLRQEEADWGAPGSQRAEKRCILYHNWRQLLHLSATAESKLPSTARVYTESV